MVGGLLRGLAGLALGITLFEIQKATSKIKFNQATVYCLWFIALFAALKLSLHSNISARDFNFIFAGSFLLLFSVRIQFTNEKLVSFSKRLGTLSYYMFLIHMLIIYIMIDFGISSFLPPTARLIVAFFLVLLVSIILMRYQNATFNLANKLFNKFFSKCLL